MEQCDLTHGSLFTGIGGFDLGAQKEGIKTLWTCDIEKYTRLITKKHFPETIQHEDIRELINPGYVDIISGGFPCQDISINGHGRGINGTRSGLWSEMFRIIRHVRPKYAIIENSPALLFRGFERILLDLSQIGYNAEWQCLSNRSFGYPHKRERIYVIAYAMPIGSQTSIFNNGKINPIFRKWSPIESEYNSIAQGIYQMSDSENIRNDVRVSSWTHRISAIGNAINPTIARYLFKCIKLHYSLNN
jgi:DNA (cytosine-5)-methyltransferase 1